MRKCALSPLCSTPVRLLTSPTVLVANTESQQQTISAFNRQVKLFLFLVLLDDATTGIRSPAQLLQQGPLAVNLYIDPCTVENATICLLLLLPRIFFVQLALQAQERPDRGNTGTRRHGTLRMLDLNKDN